MHLIVCPVSRTPTQFSPSMHIKSFVLLPDRIYHFISYFTVLSYSIVAFKRPEQLNKVVFKLEFQRKRTVP